MGIPKLVNVLIFSFLKAIMICVSLLLVILSVASPALAHDDVYCAKCVIARYQNGTEFWYDHESGEPIRHQTECPTYKCEHDASYGEDMCLETSYIMKTAITGRMEDVDTSLYQCGHKYTLDHDEVCTQMRNYIDSSAQHMIMECQTRVVSSDDEDGTQGEGEVRVKFGGVNVDANIPAFEAVGDVDEVAEGIFSMLHHIMMYPFHLIQYIIHGY